MPQPAELAKKYGWDINVLHEEAAGAGVPLPLAYSLVMTESGFNPRARSKAGAMGLGQLMPPTAKDLGVTDPWDVRQNLRGSFNYLRRRYDQTGRWDLALAAYNAGIGNVQKHGGITPFAETQAHVNNTLARAKWFEENGELPYTSTMTKGRDQIPEAAKGRSAPQGSKLEKVRAYYGGLGDLSDSEVVDFVANRLGKEASVIAESLGIGYSTPDRPGKQKPTTSQIVSQLAQSFGLGSAADEINARIMSTWTGKPYEQELKYLRGQRDIVQQDDTWGKADLAANILGGLNRAGATYGALGGTAAGAKAINAATKTLPRTMALGAAEGAHEGYWAADTDEQLKGSIGTGAVAGGLGGALGYGVAKGVDSIRDSRTARRALKGGDVPDEEIMRLSDKASEKGRRRQWVASKIDPSGRSPVFAHNSAWATGGRNPSAGPQIGVNAMDAGQTLLGLGMAAGGAELDSAPLGTLGAAMLLQGPGRRLAVKHFNRAATRQRKLSEDLFANLRDRNIRQWDPKAKRWKYNPPDDPRGSRLNVYEADTLNTPAGRGVDRATRRLTTEEPPSMSREQPRVPGQHPKPVEGQKPAYEAWATDVSRRVDPNKRMGGPPPTPPPLPNMGKGGYNPTRYDNPFVRAARAANVDLATYTDRLRKKGAPPGGQASLSGVMDDTGEVTLKGSRYKVPRGPEPKQQGRAPAYRMELMPQKARQRDMFTPEHELAAFDQYGRKLSREEQDRLIPEYAPTRGDDPREVFMDRQGRVRNRQALPPDYEMDAATGQLRRPEVRPSRLLPQQAGSGRARNPILAGPESYRSPYPVSNRPVALGARRFQVRGDDLFEQFDRAPRSPGEPLAGAPPKGPKFPLATDRRPWFYLEKKPNEGILRYRSPVEPAKGPSLGNKKAAPLTREDIRLAIERLRRKDQSVNPDEIDRLIDRVEKSPRSTEEALDELERRINAFDTDNAGRLIPQEPPPLPPKRKRASKKAAPKKEATAKKAPRKKATVKKEEAPPKPTVKKEEAPPKPTEADDAAEAARKQLERERFYRDKAVAEEQGAETIKRRNAAVATWERRYEEAKKAAGTGEATVTKLPTKEAPAKKARKTKEKVTEWVGPSERERLEILEEAKRGRRKERQQPVADLDDEREWRDHLEYLEDTVRLEASREAKLRAQGRLATRREKPPKNVIRMPGNPIFGSGRPLAREELEGAVKAAAKPIPTRVKASQDKILQQFEAAAKELRDELRNGAPRFGTYEMVKDLRDTAAKVNSGAHANKPNLARIQELTAELDLASRGKAAPLAKAAPRKKPAAPPPPKDAPRKKPAAPPPPKDDLPEVDVQARKAEAEGDSKLQSATERANLRAQQAPLEDLRRISNDGKSTFTYQQLVALADGQSKDYAEILRKIARSGKVELVKEHPDKMRSVFRFKE